jgi:threonine aldolase
MIQKAVGGPVDLRSDTVTRPTAAMREAMMAAPLGDDVFGDDPTVNALQERIASLLGFEAALFVPTGTQSNLCAILAHCQRGDEYLVGQMAHCYRWEGGGAAVLGSVQPQPIAHQADGTLALADIEAAIKPDDAHFARTRLLALENTLGGKLLPFDYVQAATALASSRGLARHLDGARCSTRPWRRQRSRVQRRARGEPHRQCFDSVSVCFSKGLGAPVGSALCGARDFIARAHRIRKMAGGGMRQAGCWRRRPCTRWITMSSAWRRTTRWRADWPTGWRASRACRCRRRRPTSCLPTSPVPRASSRGRCCSIWRAQGVLATGLYRLRFVTHLDVDAAGVDRAVAAIRQFFNA